MIKGIFKSVPGAAEMIRNQNLVLQGQNLVLQGQNQRLQNQVQQNRQGQNAFFEQAALLLAHLNGALVIGIAKGIHHGEKIVSALEIALPSAFILSTITFIFEKSMLYLQFYSSATSFLNLLFTSFCVIGGGFTAQKYLDDMKPGSGISTLAFCVAAIVSQYFVPRLGRVFAMNISADIAQDAVLYACAVRVGLCVYKSSPNFYENLCEFYENLCELISV